MGHRAAVYTVRVHKRNKPKDERLLGDIDAAGTTLGDVLQNSFSDAFRSTSDDTTRTVVCETSTTAGDGIEAMFAHGLSGVVADIVDRGGQLRLRQAIEDTQLVRCCSLFRLPPSDNLGWWAVHVNNNRSAKGLIQWELVKRFKAAFPDLMLRVEPAVLGEALTAAVDHGQIEKVRLVRLEQPHDRSEQATNKWVASEEKARLQLEITSARRGGKVLGQRLSQFLHGNTAVFGEIVEFAGLTFEEAKVEVTLEGNTRRTFNIQRPEAGHAFTSDLTNLEFQDGEPKPASVFASLRTVLDDMGA